MNTEHNKLQMSPYQQYTSPTVYNDLFVTDFLQYALRKAQNIKLQTYQEL